MSGPNGDPNISTDDDIIDNEDEFRVQLSTATPSGEDQQSLDKDSPASEGEKGEEDKAGLLNVTQNNIPPTNMSIFPFLKCSCDRIFSVPFM
uniref:Uncharacterized protein n=1 Tax=Oncorhynchus mykiss TaxID=8022 RepID=A0A8C7SBK9_ONCMY